MLAANFTRSSAGNIGVSFSLAGGVPAASEEDNLRSTAGAAHA
jgi:hypothetical protein